MFTARGARFMLSGWSALTQELELSNPSRPLFGFIQGVDDDSSGVGDIEARMTRSSGSPVASTSDQLSGIMKTLEAMTQVMQQQVRSERNDGARTSNRIGLGIEAV
ncbi:hypothetical protein MUK42_13451 [Musa troglodytarum]|uniref:Uncharacterized protein n=1 Tax=Musa troglodytarum TaxID=320322 RepID=A0A9E7H3B7_9LILI|nr:hypothetical protein MUK42_13451 [Musa troglodytarum]